jgi:hypothetical protein
MVCQFPLSANSGKPIAIKKYRNGFQQKMQGKYQLWIWMGLPLSVLCSGSHMYTVLIWHIFWLKPLKPHFCDLKSKFPLNLKIKYQQFNVWWRPLDWYQPLLTPVKTHWTKPLIMQSQTTFKIIGTTQVLRLKKVLSWKIRTIWMVL